MEKCGGIDHQPLCRRQVEALNALLGRLKSLALGLTMLVNFR